MNHPEATVSLLLVSLPQVSAAKVFGAIVIVLAIVIAAGLAFYCYFRCRDKPKS